ncbi:MAG: 50S ribosomal protein L27 [Candidatus Omnitrophica bacterium]|nr:50S ribosomal protein L27 [Candidatus Omnitrophota bacterium]
MVGGKSRPRKDQGVKVSEGQMVKTGQILSREYVAYKPGRNVGGLTTLFALCNGKIHFSKKKTPHGKVRTFLNILPEETA